jgi:hypothetical protein
MYSIDKIGFTNAEKSLNFKKIVFLSVFIVLMCAPKKSDEKYKQAIERMDKVVSIIRIQLENYRYDNSLDEKKNLLRSILISTEPYSNSEILDGLSQSEIEALNVSMKEKTADIAPILQSLSKTLNRNSQARLVNVNSCAKCCSCIFVHQKCCGGKQPGNGLCFGVWACPSNSNPQSICVDSESCPCF